MLQNVVYARLTVSIRQDDMYAIVRKNYCVLMSMYTGNKSSYFRLSEVKIHESLLNYHFVCSSLKSNYPFGGKILDSVLGRMCQTRCQTTWGDQKSFVFFNSLLSDG